MSLTHSEVRKVLDLLDRAENLESLEIRLGELVLRAHKPGAAAAGLPLAGFQAPASSAPAAPTAPTVLATPAVPATVPASSAAEEIPAGMTAIRAPMLGTFYRTPAPDQPPFVQEGGRVAGDDTVCLVEVMKMFNTVKTPVAGRIHRILAEHGKLVQHNQILMLIEG
jgi:acetyl-CoA carboxylase biotin carboxyl carrier protein